MVVPACLLLLLLVDSRHFFFLPTIWKKDLIKRSLDCGKSLLREAYIVVLHLLRFRLAWVDVQAIALTYESKKNEQFPGKNRNW